MVVKNEEQKTIIVYIPRCPKCQKSMTKRNAEIAPPPDAFYADNTLDNQYMLIGSFTFFCLQHPEQIEVLTRDQLSVINTYPISKQFYRDMDLYNRENRRHRKHK